VAEAAAARDTRSAPSRPLEAFAGRYRDPWYGDVRLDLQDGRLTLRFTHTASLVGTVEHWQYDTFVVRWQDRTLDADAYLTFALNPDGTIAQARMQAVSPATDFSFDFQDLVLTPVPAGTPPR